MSDNLKDGRNAVDPDYDTGCNSNLKPLMEGGRAVHTILAALRAWQRPTTPTAENETDPTLVEAAREQYQSDNIDVDMDAKVSPADGGAWVNAWVWVADQDKED